jgi:hypothetical protein
VDYQIEEIEKEGGLMLSRPTVDVRDVIYGLTSSDCTSAHPGVTKGGQGRLPDSGEKVKVVKSIPKLDKLLLAAGLKVTFEIYDYSYFFQKLDNDRIANPHSVPCHALQIFRKNTEKYSEKKVFEEKKTN